MRTYAPYNNKKQASQAGKKKERAERYSNEWDVRIDCDKTYANDIVENLKNASNILEYALVSGIERPDTESAGDHGAQENHVHIALVFQYQLRRDQVLTTLRGFFKKTDEYAVPRNRKFTYAGWFLHHTKIDWKLATEKSIRYEYGILPHDPVDDDTKKSVVRMFNKFGRASDIQEEENRTRFQLWLEWRWRIIYIVHLRLRWCY